MSGHSKWSTIKRQKAVTDARRSAMFTKYARLITIAARTGGGDPNMNVRLRFAIDQARSINMPNDNIDRAIRSGTGESRGDQVKELVYEGFGPAGVAVVIETVSDNPNRTASDLRTLFQKHGGTLGTINSVQWMFDRQGKIRISRSQVSGAFENFLLRAIDAGAHDVAEDSESVILTCPIEKFTTLRNWVEQQGFHPDEAAPELIPQTTVELSDTNREQLHTLLSALDDHPDVTSVVTNEA